MRVPVETRSYGFVICLSSVKDDKLLMILLSPRVSLHVTRISNHTMIQSWPIISFGGTTALLQYLSCIVRIAQSDPCNDNTSLVWTIACTCMAWYIRNCIFIYIYILYIIYIYIYIIFLGTHNSMTSIASPGMIVRGSSPFCQSLSCCQSPSSCQSLPAPATSEPTILHQPDDLFLIRLLVVAPCYKRNATPPRVA